MNQPERYVAYYRMPSVDDPHWAGTLERQKKLIGSFLDGADHLLVGEFTEVIRPAQEDEVSPALELALMCCHGHDAKLVVAPDGIALGEASRERARIEDVEILSIDADETAASSAPHRDGPAEDAPYLDLRASTRTPVPLRTRSARPGPAGNKDKADRFARAMLPIIEQIRASGITTLSDIADELNARRVRTARGRRWYPTTVRNILNRRPDEPSDTSE